LKPIYLFLTLLFAALIGSALYLFTPSQQKSTAPSIVTSTYLLSAISNKLTNSLSIAPATSLLKAGMDAHSFTPTAQQVKQLESAHVVFFLNTEFDHWINKHTTHGVDVGKQVIKINEGTHTDPHYWMSITNLIRISTTMKNALIKAYPNDATTIEKNFIALNNELNLLQKQAMQRFASCKNPTIIMTHNALAYLAHEYHFSVLSLEGVHPDAQASAKTFSTLQAFAQSHHINTLFYESQEPSKVLQALQPSATLHPIYLFTSDEPIYHKKGVLPLMRENLNALSKAMQCQ